MQNHLEMLAFSMNYILEEINISLYFENRNKYNFIC